MNLFRGGVFTLHSEEWSSWKIDCDALTPTDWATIAHIIVNNFEFGAVHAVPRGGVRLAAALQPYCRKGAWPLIVDDVLTTGASMEATREKLQLSRIRCWGVVLFARGRPPSWVHPVFQFRLGRS